MLGTMLSYGLATSMVGTLGYYATLYYVCRATSPWARNGTRAWGWRAW